MYVSKEGRKEGRFFRAGEAGEGGKWEGKKSD